jgi:hypothetical protein
VAREHGGICRSVKRFGDAALREAALRVERDCGPSFEELRATLRVRPIRISGLRYVGDGVSLDLDPHDVKAWEWWGDFETDIEVRRRRRFSRQWAETRSAAQVEEWLRREAATCLADLREKEASLAKSEA